MVTAGSVEKCRDVGQVKQFEFAPMLTHWMFQWRRGDAHNLSYITYKLILEQVIVSRMIFIHPGSASYKIALCRYESLIVQSASPRKPGQIRRSRHRNSRYEIFWSDVLANSGLAVRHVRFISGSLIPMYSLRQAA